jgi:hypothetical protein
MNAEVRSKNAEVEAGVNEATGPTSAFCLLTSDFDTAKVARGKQQLRTESK